MHHVRMMKDLNPKARLPFHPLPTYYSRRLEGGGGEVRGGVSAQKSWLRKPETNCSPPSLHPSNYSVVGRMEGGGECRSCPTKVQYHSNKED